MKTLLTRNNVSLSYVKEVGDGRSEFATHRFKRNDDGSLDKFWGHYFRDFKEAKRDFYARAGTFPESGKDAFDHSAAETEN